MCQQTISSCLYLLDLSTRSIFFFCSETCKLGEIVTTCCFRACLLLILLLRESRSCNLSCDMVSQTATMRTQTHMGRPELSGKITHLTCVSARALVHPAPHRSSPIRHKSSLSRRCCSRQPVKASLGAGQENHKPFLESCTAVLKGRHSLDVPCRSRARSFS